jgi:hypothetical protein
VVVGGRTKKIGCCDYEINNLKEKKKNHWNSWWVCMAFSFSSGMNEKLSPQPLRQTFQSEKKGRRERCDNSTRYPIQSVE